MSVKLVAPTLRSFRVEAGHPAYIGALRQDRFDPDWRNCAEIPRGAEYQFTPARVTLAETLSWQIVGLTFAKFWRPATAPVTIGGKTYTNIHLIQLWTRVDQRAEEVLVLYPGDGYWRARPLPPKHLGWSAYGSSVLIGPVEEQGRPIVDLKAVRIDLDQLIFDLDFVKGGSARVQAVELDREHIALDVRFSGAIPNAPFAALRSMFVTDINADVAEVKWRAPGAQHWRQEGIDTFQRADAAEVWLGRKLFSRHNTSAPDMLFSGFRDDGAVAGNGPAKAAER